jgi:hypothetical protein
MGISNKAIVNPSTSVSAGFSLQVDVVDASSNAIPVSKLIYGAAGSTGTIVSSSNPLPVVIESSTTISVSGSTIAVTQSGTWTVSVSGSTLSVSGSTVSVSGSTIAVTQSGTWTTRPPNGTLDTFGHLKIATINNQIDVQFFRDQPANLLTVTSTQSGAATSTGGMATFTTGATINSIAKGVTTQNTVYTSGSEVFAEFTAAWTGTGGTGSYQRIGLYDDNNGLFLSDEAGTWGLTIRKGSTDVQTAKASFSEDALTGASTSLFKRAGTAEAIDLTKLNVFRLRFGWLGSAPVVAEVMAPDGDWVPFHKIKQPNLAALPSINTADLPMTCEVANASNSTTLSILTNCWGAGTTQFLQTLDATVTDDTFAGITRSVIVGKKANGTYANVAITNNGNFKVALDEYDGVPTGSGTASGALRVELPTDGTGKVSVSGSTISVSGSTISVSGSTISVSGSTVSVSGSTVAVTQSGTWTMSASSDAVGSTPYFDSAADATVQTMLGAAGRVYFIELSNPSTTDAFLQLFDTSTSITLGTSTPVLSLFVPAGDGTRDGARDAYFEPPLNFANTIKYGVTNLVQGSTLTAGSPCVLNASYK